MLSALDSESHRTRLRKLGNSFRTQERFMMRALASLQERLDTWHEAHDSEDQNLLEDLHLEHGGLTAELHHIRMAMTGASNELALHERQPHLQDNDYERLGA